MQVSDKNQLIIQSYFMTSFIYALNNNNFLDSDFYKNLEFGDPFVHENLPKIGLGNLGTMLFTLYSMLVLPRELFKKDYKVELESLDPFISNLTSYEETDYRTDLQNIKYIKHIRNAVAHGRVTINTEGEAVFYDKNVYLKKGKDQQIEKCVIIIPLDKLDLLIVKLQEKFLNYIVRLQNNHSQKVSDSE